MQINKIIHWITSCYQDGIFEHGFADAKHEETLHIDEKLEYVRRKEKRSPLNPLIPVLNGYQQGRCFYCGEPIQDSIFHYVVLPDTELLDYKRLRRKKPENY